MGRYPRSPTRWASPTPTRISSTRPTNWLIERQGAIEKRLAKRHLKAGGLVLFDLTSSYFEGVTCPLAKLGYSRDGKPGTLQVNWGLLTDGRGCPVAVSVFEGNTGDPKTLLPQVEKVRASFGVDRWSWRATAA